MRKSCPSVDVGLTQPCSRVSTRILHAGHTLNPELKNWRIPEPQWLVKEGALQSFITPWGSQHSTECPTAKTPDYFPPLPFLKASGCFCRQLQRIQMKSYFISSPLLPAPQKLPEEGGSSLQVQIKTSVLGRSVTPTHARWVCSWSCPALPLHPPGREAAGPVWAVGRGVPDGFCRSCSTIREGEERNRQTDRSSGRSVWRFSPRQQLGPDASEKGVKSSWWAIME